MFSRSKVTLRALKLARNRDVRQAQDSPFLHVGPRMIPIIIRAARYQRFQDSVSKASQSLLPTFGLEAWKLGSPPRMVSQVRLQEVVPLVISDEPESKGEQCYACMQVIT